MFQESGGLPVSGGLVLAGLIYAGVSIFVTGPMVSTRTIEKSGWDARCKQAVHDNIRAQEPEPVPVPKFDCDSMIGSLFGSDGKAWCQAYGRDFKLPFADQIENQQRRLRELNKRRMALATSKAGSRCACAVSLTLEKRRIPLAIYAGSLRLVTPPSVSNLDAELMSALHSSACRQSR